MRYPVADVQDWDRVGRLSLSAKLALSLREARYRRRAKLWKSVDLQKVKGAEGELSAKDIVLICTVRDGEKYLPSLLSHYRALGVARFAFVDDRSQDGTVGLLVREPDVDVYRSNVGFQDSNGGLVWRDMLVAIYGRNRWYVSIDCDEYLVFPGSEGRSLQSFTADLDRQGLRRILAAMVDIYADGRMGATGLTEPADAFPAEVCPLYDGSDYSIADDKFCTAVRGGPRLRLFGADMRLSKFPLLFADEKTQFAGGSHHGPLPLNRNFGPVRAVLLHFKFPQGAVEEFRTIAERGSHFGGSHYYRQIVSHPAFGEEADFRYPQSRRYGGSRKLVDEGFMQDLRPGHA